MGFLYCFKNILAIEKERIYNKNYLVAMAINIICFTSAPHIMRQVFTLIDGWQECYKFLVLLVGCYGIFQIIMYNGMDWIMHAKIPYLEQFRVDTSPWPWEKDPEAWKVTKKRVKDIKRKNGMIGMSIFLVISFYFQFWNTSLDAIPTSWEILWQVFLCMLWIDVWNYCFHTIYHHPYLYQRIHKIHHEFQQVQSHGASHSHWLEYLTMAMIPSLIVPILLGKQMHLGTLCFWSLFRQMEAADHHIGYEFPWIPFRVVPFSVTAEYHSYHHSHNQGNLVTYFSILDTIFCTNENYFRYQEQREKEKEKQHEKAHLANGKAKAK